jgi:hypothetical protein
LKKLKLLKKTRLATESLRLDPEFEKELSEFGIESDVLEWPDY